MDRQQKIIVISKRLVIFVAISLIAASALFSITFLFEKHFMISWFSFECGIIGGFVSIQQRLRRLDDAELTILSQSWMTVLVIPVYGGIFSLVLYLLFLSGLIEGHLFPHFSFNTFSDPPQNDDLRKFFIETYPSSASDFAKFAFWSFVAGFSERFVPQIIQKVSSEK